MRVDGEKRNTNVFVLTTEYHFLLSMSIIHERYTSMEFRNILVFTAERLSGIVTKNLPVNVETIVIRVEQERNLKKTIHDNIIRHDLANLFVFTAYRDLETYLLCVTKGSVLRHLVQDGANFYFNILKPVTLSRIKETIKIYVNLWKKGIFFTKLVLYKKHLAHCGFIDDVWITNPEIYKEPPFASKPVVKIDLQLKGKTLDAFCKYFGKDLQISSNSVIYLSSRLTQENQILSEISLLKSIIAKLNRYRLVIKLHPGSPDIQVDLFKAAFKDCVFKNFIPAELYIAQVINSYVIGVASASLFYNNPRCTYFTLVKIYQELGIFSDWIEVKLPPHVNVIASLKEFDLLQN